MTRVRRMRATWCAVLAALLLVALGTEAAAPSLVAAAEHAQPSSKPGLEVSEDGAHYSDDVTTPLFADLGRLVPGDRVAVTLWARNSSEIAGVLRLSGTGAWSSSAEFASAIAISAGPAGGDPDAPVPLGSAAECALLFRGPVLEPGETMPLSIVVAFDPAVGGRTGAEDSAGLDFVVALRDPADPVAETADCASGTVVPGLPDGSGGAGHEARPGGRGGRMADTGADIGAPLAGGTLFVLGGLAALALLAVAERRRSGGDRARSDRAGSDRARSNG